MIFMYGIFLFCCNGKWNRREEEKTNNNCALARFFSAICAHISMIINWNPQTMKKKKKRKEKNLHMLIIFFFFKLPMRKALLANVSMAKKYMQCNLCILSLLKTVSKCDITFKNDQKKK